MLFTHVTTRHVQSRGRVYHNGKIWLRPSISESKLFLLMELYSLKQSLEAIRAGCAEGDRSDLALFQHELDGNRVVTTSTHVQAGNVDSVLVVHDDVCFAS